MIYGHILASETFQFLQTHPVWKQAFDWLKTVTGAKPPGIYRLHGEEMFVNVHGYKTLPREECRFESHRHYLDLQYCVHGGELIDWQESSRLQTDGAYDETKDVQFYQAQDTKTVLHMLPGNFVIFHPSDGHRPKCSDTVHPEVFKLVIKIAAAII
jgi:YhcH/YjgK/YiaL family protein